MQVINQSRTDYKYQLSPTSPIITDTMVSNIVSTTIIPINLTVVDAVTPTIASLYDTLTYTVVVTNNSCFVAQNVLLKPILAKEVEIVPFSITIDGKPTPYENFENPIPLGDMDPKQVITVVYKAVIIAIPPSSIIPNQAVASFEYTYNVEEPPIVIYVSSNIVTTEVINTIFKQINVNYNICIPSRLPCIKSIFNVKSFIEVLEVKLVENPCLNMLENNTYKTLIIIGRITFEILYADSDNCSGYKGHDCNSNYIKYKSVEGFSTFMIVPIETPYIKNKDVKVDTESLSYYLTNSRCTFINLDLLITIEP